MNMGQDEKNNICVIRVPGRKQEKKREPIFEDIIVKKSSN